MCTKFGAKIEKYYEIEKCLWFGVPKINKIHCFSE
jgi:hypothetical protein